MWRPTSMSASAGTAHAVLQGAGGQVRSQRFESRVPGVAPEAEAVGPALNEAANAVAGQVAAWVG